MVILYIYSICWRMKLVFYERQHLASNEITTHGYRALTFVKTTIMIDELTIMNSLGSS
jgi:hypothetical protein